VNPRRSLELTEPELSNLRHLSHGLTWQEAADCRFVSVETVASQMQLAKLKLAEKTQTHAVALALRLGLID